MPSPGIITQRLTLQDDGCDENDDENDDENEVQSLLEEVIVDLQTLSGKQLCERINQRKVLLRDILDESTDPKEKEIVQRMLSPHAQYQFLLEHLDEYDIIAVLASLDPDHPFLLRHIEHEGLLESDHPYHAAQWGYVMSVQETLKPKNLANYFVAVIKQLQAKAEEDKKIVTLSGEIASEYDMTQLHLARMYECYAHCIQKTKILNKYSKAANAYALAYDALKDNMYIQDYPDLDLLAKQVKALWEGGDLTEAENVSLELMDMINYHSMQLSEDNIEEEQMLFQYFAEAGMTYIQILLEMQQQLSNQEETPENEAELFDCFETIKEEIQDMYDLLVYKGYIQEYQCSSHALVHQRRFVRGRYLRQTEQYIRAHHEFSLIDQDNHPDLKNAITTLKETRKISFIADA